MITIGWAHRKWKEIKEIHKNGITFGEVYFRLLNKFGGSLNQISNLSDHRQMFPNSQGKLGKIRYSKEEFDRLSNTLLLSKWPRNYFVTPLANLSWNVFKSGVWQFGKSIWQSNGRLSNLIDATPKSNSNFLTLLSIFRKY